LYINEFYVFSYCFAGESLSEPPDPLSIEFDDVTNLALNWGDTPEFLPNLNIFPRPPYSIPEF